MRLDQVLKYKLHHRWSGIEDVGYSFKHFYEGLLATGDKRFV